ncbi:histone-lysine N-methyltransferase, H3 lysine-9 specific SUVH5 isoform X2 [Spinacia oleracea]|nr:histone-lysine N-methyltransferase, H3 lysine-9 specific SUVH5-like isoform X2 [Spinacia oleracea]
MSPAIDEEMLLNILDNSLLITPPEYERQETSPLRDFHNVCGPIPSRNNMQNRGGVCGQREGDFREKGRNLREVKGEIFSEESESHIPVCLNGVELASSSSVKLETVDYDNGELPEMPVVNPELPSDGQYTSIHDPKEPADVIKHEVVDEANTVQPCLIPHGPIPSNLQRKEQRYPSRKRVSSNCDFRRSKAPRLSKTQDKHLGQRETVSNIHKEVMMKDVDQIVEEPNDNVSKDKKQQDVEHEDFFDDGRGEGTKQSEINGKVSTFSIKVQNNKKKSTRLSCSNIKLEEGRNVGVENSRVMSAPSSPRRDGEAEVETSQSMAEGKKKNGTKRGCAMRKKRNCSPEKNNARRKVRDTLRLFHGVLRKLVQADEKKSKGRVDASIQISVALKIFKDHGKYIDAKKRMGRVPGVEVGDLFNYRVELDIIGLHKPLQSGIDFFKLDDELIAISVVASGRYDNVVENSDVLIYVGQGGNVAGGCKQLEDQKLLGGNLALKNSIDKKNPVRVIRGFKERKTIRGKRVTIPTYVYDGLYTVERCWKERGPHGKLIYKFELLRIPNQPELTWKKLVKVKKSKKSKRREGHVDDVSQGKEETPICAVNTIDGEKPSPFTYITSVMYPDWCRPLPLKGCDCKDGCSDSKHCACALKNGGEIPYNYSGAIVEEKSLVYECGPSCKCPPTCHNRVSQHGIKLPLEIFKTEARGWGVRSSSSIPSGSFVCEYIGELLDDKEAEQRIDDDEYLFDIGRNYNDPTLRDGLSTLMPDMPSSRSDVVENVGFTIDARKFGNIGRFINHSCSPNLFAQNVLYDHEDKRIPHIMMFASENIPPLQELTYHYNYTLDHVFDSEGNIKKKSCHCGSSECTGRMY